MHFHIIKTDTLKINNFFATHDRVAIGRHIPCTRHPQTCHLWKLALDLYDVQLDSDCNMLETMHKIVNWPLELVIYCHVLVLKMLYEIIFILKYFHTPRLITRRLGRRHDHRCFTVIRFV